ncbi:hypothetical protein [Streptomyces abikoensis]
MPAITVFARAAIFRTASLTHVCRTEQTIERNKYCVNKAASSVNDAIRRLAATRSPALRSGWLKQIGLSPHHRRRVPTVPTRTAVLVLPPLLSNQRGASPMADLAFIGLVVASFVVLHFIVKGVERL